MVPIVTLATAPQQIWDINLELLPSYTAMQDSGVPASTSSTIPFYSNYAEGIIVRQYRNASPLTIDRNSGKLVAAKDYAKRMVIKLKRSAFRETKPPKKAKRSPPQSREKYTHKELNEMGTPDDFAILFLNAATPARWANALSHHGFSPDDAGKSIPKRVVKEFLADVKRAVQREQGIVFSRLPVEQQKAFGKQLMARVDDLKK